MTTLEIAGPNLIAASGGWKPRDEETSTNERERGNRSVDENSQFELSSEGQGYQLKIWTNAAIEISGERGGNLLVRIVPHQPESVLPPLNMDRVQAGIFLERLYARSSRGGIDGAIDRVIDFIDMLLSWGEIGTCEELLRQADPHRMETSISLAILSMTVVEKDRLGPARSGFYGRLRDFLTSTRDEATVSLLLKGLE